MNHLGARRRGSAAIYLVPHQDDEALTLGAAILADRAAGHRVYAIIITDGKRDGTRSMFTGVLGYTPSYEEFSAARDREFVAGIQALGAIPIVAPFADRQPDGASTVAGVVALVKSVSPVPGGADVLLRATGTSDYHRDHRNCGDALVQLYNEGWGTDPRLMYSGYKKTLAPVGTYEMGSHGDLTVALQWPYRTQDIPNGWWGIGYTSVPEWFDYVVNTDSRTYWHRPLPQ